MSDNATNDDGRFPIDRVGAAILDLLAGNPGPPRALLQDEIAAVLELHRSTVRARLSRLMAAGLLDRPHGPRSGYALTPEGKSAISAQPPAVRKAWGLK